MIDERAREINRIQKVLEGANIKLSSVVSDVLGKSGRAMIEAMIRGQQSPEALSELAKGNAWFNWNTSKTYARQST